MADMEYAKDKIMMGSERRMKLASISHKQMLARLDVCMGVRVTEELIFGENEVSSSASSDLQQATKLARAMVTKYGMSKEVGVVTHNYDDNGKSMSMSIETRLLIEKEVKYFLERAYNNAKTILTTHSMEIHALTNALLEHETLTGNHIKSVLAQSQFTAIAATSADSCTIEQFTIQPNATSINH
ncbi:hypothetical protein Pint_31008 [Pistacia integerrima]|uniref:Uncharacterized protein n=1 Tax=Pistacia integerrima TaxID=434235 RepID=A0ACC0XTM5_9ROSI|nr:hypothetical protein Pint_31008 [Pistacia integerrima]